MNLTEFKTTLNNLSSISFHLPDGTKVPEHFHLTEIGKVTKSFIDCGGTLRQEKKVSLQLWTALDYDHRLETKTLLGIIEMAEDTFNLGNLEIEVQYQGQNTLETYGLDTNGNFFLLTSLSTACLAPNACDITNNMPLEQENSASSNNNCKPNSGCC